MSSTTAETVTPPEQEKPTVSALGRAQTNAGFTGLTKEFNQNLCVEQGKNVGRKLLLATADGKPYLPGQPRIRLDQRQDPGKQDSSENPVVSERPSQHAEREASRSTPPQHHATITATITATGSSPNHNSPDRDPLHEYLEKCHTTGPLDALLPLMRYIFVQTPSYKHVMPLHHQKTHAREIKVAEHPGLHLVWFYEIVFIKPIPAYFYCKAFWEYLENVDKDLHKACLGFMRSYYMLIQYSIDYDEACKLNLIPTKDGTAAGERPTYEEWCEFIEPFARVGDKHVSRRYHYGELRLTRLNRAAFLFKGNLAYFHIYPQWGSFLEHTLAPIITIFAVCSIVLNAMQVSLAAMEVGNEVDTETLSRGWLQFLDASLWFPVVVMLSIAAVLGVAVIGMGVMGIRDFWRGNQVRRKRKSGDYDSGNRTHGMVW